MRYWLWRFRAFLYIYSLNVRDLWRALRLWQRDRWRIHQAWAQTMDAATWRDYYDDGFTPRDAMHEDWSNA